MSQEIEEFTTKIAAKLRGQPTYFYDLLTSFPSRSYREILAAWSKVREEHNLLQDEAGRYYIDDALG